MQICASTIYCFKNTIDEVKEIYKAYRLSIRLSICLSQDEPLKPEYRSQFKSCFIKKNSTCS